MAPITKPGPFSKIERVQWGPLMRDLGLFVTKQMPPAMVHDGDTRVTESSNHRLTMEYAKSTDQYKVVMQLLPDNNAFVCDFCTESGERVAWCTHIHYVMTNRLDKGLFTSEGGRFVVPIVPTEGIFCPVHVTEVDADVSRRSGLPTMHRVHMVMGNRETKEDENIVIGYLRAGHYGAFDLRNLFSDWAQGWLDNDTYYAPTTCSDPKHEDDPSRSKFSQRFFPAMYGLCPRCMDKYEAEPGTTENDGPNPDDAPDF